jgi:hypothetical protein
MHASSDLRIVKCLDGLHYSFEILEHLNKSLYEECCRINSDPSSVIPAIWRCWSFVDVVHRIREIAQSIPGLSNRTHELVSFLADTAVAEDCRHYIQHLRSELLRKDTPPFPVWGSLAWVDPKDATSSYIAVMGAQIEGIH